MAWLADKMAKWEKAIDRRGSPGAGRRVIEGWEKPGDRPGELAEWSLGAQSRLEREVPDPDARKEIMTERSCVFAEEFGDGDLRRLAELYARTGDPESVLAAMRENGGRFGDPRLSGDAIVEIRRPRDPEAFKAATTERERRIAACYCPLAREAEGDFPLEYCCCSAGWYKGIYEAIFGRPVAVTVDESLLHGDARCAFTVRIPGALGVRERS